MCVNTSLSYSNLLPVKDPQHTSEGTRAHGQKELTPLRIRSMGVGRPAASVAALATQALAAMTSTVLPLKELEEITKTWKSGGDKRM